jgi:maleylacetoacetate isomerase/maleylpyruvate isomerase
VKLRLFNTAVSSPSYRVRIALGLKGLDYEYVPVDLKTRAHKAAAYLAINPQGLLPTLEVDGVALTQSSAIIEWLEETFPEPRLFPADPFLRARVRAVASIVATDIAPLHSMRVSLAVRNDFAQGDEGLRAWVHRFMSDGLTAVEAILQQLPGPYACGEAPGVADIYLVPSMRTAKAVGVDLANLPRVATATSRAMEHPAFAAARPSRQPDA